MAPQSRRNRDRSIGSTISMAGSAVDINSIETADMGVMEIKMNSAESVSVRYQVPIRRSMSDLAIYRLSIVTMSA